MRKAITPVVSVILLIMLVVAITGAAWYWMTNVQGSLQESAGSNIEQTSDLATTQFTIVSVLCNATEDLVNATIINTGSNSIASTANWIITVSSLQGAVLASDLTTTDETGADIGEILAGAAEDITSGSGVGTNLTAGTTYSIKLNVGSSSQTSTCTAN